MILSISDVFPGDWQQFVSSLVATIIGTLIGIVGPFYVQSILEKKEKRKKAVGYLRDIKKELEDVKQQFNSIKKTDLYLSPIKTPLWDSLINTNQIKLLSTLRVKKTGFALATFTKQLFQIYDWIGEYNSWWNVYVNGAIVGARTKEDLSAISEFINESQEHLLCEDKNNQNYHKSINFALDIINDLLNHLKCDRVKEE